VDTPPKQMSLAHTRLVLPPLLITTAFCFVLAMTQQPVTDNQASAAEKSGSQTRSGLSSTPLKPAQTLEQVNVAASNAAQSAQAASQKPASKTTAQPQPNANAAPGSAVQPAAPATVPNNSVLKVVQPVTKTLQTLLP
jgi:hypothetical protein